MEKTAVETGGGIVITAARTNVLQEEVIDRPVAPIVITENRGLPIQPQVYRPPPLAVTDTEGKCY